MAYSVDFFERQFVCPTPAMLQLNPFEQRVLPYLAGDVLDYGCGLGNLACAAASRGCRVEALDGSASAIAHLRSRAAKEGLAINAAQADLRNHALRRPYDCVVSIGLLMFFDCPTAAATLAALQAAVRPGGMAAINLLVQGTTYLDMFDPEDHCLWPAQALQQHFDGWTLLAAEAADFEAPGGTVKRFATVIARRPVA